MVDCPHGYHNARYCTDCQDREAMQKALDADVREIEDAHEEIARLTALLGRLICEACPENWSDDEVSALAWLEAERMSGEPLPDEDYNGAARAELAVLHSDSERAT